MEPGFFLNVKRRIHKVHILPVQFLAQQFDAFAETGSMKQCYL
jgi:hypothetical protein